MPLCVKSRDVILHDGPIAGTALGCEHVEVIVAAVGLSLSFVEAFLAELFPALGAEEVLHVPRLLQSGHAFLQHFSKVIEGGRHGGRDTYIQDRTVTVSTSGTEQVVVVRFAVRLPIPFEEVARPQLLGAVGAREVLRMPRLSQGGDDLPHDRLLAGVAASLLARVDPLPAHVRLQVAEHRIQVLFGRRRRRGAQLLDGLSGTSVSGIGDRLVLRLSRTDLEKCAILRKSTSKYRTLPQLGF